MKQNFAYTEDPLSFVGGSSLYNDLADHEPSKLCTYQNI